MELWPSSAAWRAQTRRRRRTSDVESRRPVLERNSAGSRSPPQGVAAALEVARHGAQRGLGGVELERAQVEADELLRLQPAAAGELEHGAVAQLQRGRGRDPVQQPGHLVVLEHARRGPRAARRTPPARGRTPGTPRLASMAMASFFIETSTGQVATQRQLVEAGIVPPDEQPQLPWHRIQGTARRVHHVVRRDAQAGEGRVHRHAGTSPRRPPCLPAGGGLGGGRRGGYFFAPLRRCRSERRPGPGRRGRSRPGCASARSRATPRCRSSSRRRCRGCRRRRRCPASGP